MQTSKTWPRWADPNVSRAGAVGKLCPLPRVDLSGYCRHAAVRMRRILQVACQACTVRQSQAGPPGYATSVSSQPRTRLTSPRNRPLDASLPLPLPEGHLVRGTLLRADRWPPPPLVPVRRYYAEGDREDGGGAFRPSPDAHALTPSWDSLPRHSRRRVACCKSPRSRHVMTCLTSVVHPRRRLITSIGRLLRGS